VGNLIMDEKELLEKQARELEELITPEPDKEQYELWEKLDAVFDKPTLERELKFIELPKQTQNYLASLTLAVEIQNLSEQLKLTSQERNNIVQLIRYIAINEYNWENKEKILRENIGFEPEKIQQLLTNPNLEKIIKEVQIKIGSVSPPPPQEKVVISEIKPASQNKTAPPLVTPPPPPPRPTPPQPQPKPEPAIQKPITNEQESREDRPFILHEEKPLFSPTGPNEKPSVDFKPQNFAQQKPSVNIKPSTARVETSSTKPQASQTRVVHYSDLRTKIDDEK
jgi:hypothetical protein